MPYRSLVLIEARGKLKKLNALLGALRSQGSTGIASGGWRLMATGGHFRSLLEATPYFEPPRREVDRPLQELRGDELKFVKDQIAAFLKANPATTPVSFTVHRPGGWNPDPESNPARYLAIGAPPKPGSPQLSGEVRSRPPFQPWFEVRSLQVWRELNQAVRELSPDGIVYLATDDDEEGEAIAWHLMEVISELAQRPVDFRRVRYSALTLSDVRDGFVAADKGERVSPGLVAAQQAREKLDRIVGYCCSRAIWSLGQMPGGRALSLGRVQLAALLLLLEADERVLQSLPQITWAMELHGENFVAKWSSNKPLDRVPDVAALPAQVAAVPAVVRSYEKSQSDLPRFPLYTLSRLQDDGYRTYKLSAQAVLDIGQTLYLSGICSYPRSDSDQVSLPTLKFLQQLGKTAGVTQQAPNVVRRQGAREQGAHEAIVPLDSPVANAWAAIVRAELAGKSSPTVDDVVAGRGPLGKAAADALGTALGERGGSFSVLARVYDLIFRRSLAALMPAARIESVELALNHEAVPTQDGKPVDFKARHDRLVSPGGYAVWRFKGTWPEKGSPLPAFRSGQRVAVTMPAKAVNTSIKAEPRPTIQTLVRKELEKRGIGRPSSTAGALETLGKRGYVRPAGEGREGMTRFGAFVAGLARHTLRGVASIETTGRMDRAATALREAVRDTDALHVRMLEQFWNDGLFARLRETRLTAWQLGNTSGPGLSLLSGYFPGGKDPNADAMREAVRGISGAGWKADAVLDRELAEDLPVGRDFFVPAKVWHHWGGLRWMAGEARGDFAPVVLVWQPKAGDVMIRAYWAYPCAARMRTKDQTESVRRCLMFSLLSSPSRLRGDLALLVEHLLLPLREVDSPITYLGAWDKLLGAWNRMKRADGEIRLDPNGIMVDMPRHENLTSVWSLPHRVR